MRSKYLFGFEDLKRADLAVDVADDWNFFGCRCFQDGAENVGAKSAVKFYGIVACALGFADQRPGLLRIFRGDEHFVERRIAVSGRDGGTNGWADDFSIAHLLPPSQCGWRAVHVQDGGYAICNVGEQIIGGK